MSQKEYTNNEITIVWQAEKCIHSGICVRSLPEVYRPKEHPWINMEHASTGQLRKQVAMCPSGALSIGEH
ncbi:MAG: (4Fe-4S)-binding protein [Saprospiraceae bacterium]